VHKLAAGAKSLIAIVTGKVIKLEIDIERATVSDIKAEIEEQEGILADVQRLIFDGKMLEDKSPLKNLGIKPGSTIFMVLRLRTVNEEDTSSMSSDSDQERRVSYVRRPLLREVLRGSREIVRVRPPESTKKTFLEKFLDRVGKGDRSRSIQMHQLRR
jgi:hypothetical protein